MQFHRDAADALVKVFASADAPFRTTSDDLLKFVSGKRAEVIAARRKVLTRHSLPTCATFHLPPCICTTKPPPVASTSAPAATFHHLRRKPTFQSSRRATGRKDTLGTSNRLEQTDLPARLMCAQTPNAPRAPADVTPSVQVNVLCRG